MFFICKNYIFSNFTLNKKFCSSKWWGGGVERHCPFFLYGPAFIIDFRQTSLTLTDFTDRRPITSFKTDSSTGISPWILQNFEKKNLFCKSPANCCVWNSKLIWRFAKFGEKHQCQGLRCRLETSYLNRTFKSRLQHKSFMCFIFKSLYVPS